MTKSTVEDGGLKIAKLVCKTMKRAQVGLFTESRSDVNFKSHFQVFRRKLMFARCGWACILAAI
jgi:hypothetical protein